MKARYIYVLAVALLLSMLACAAAYAQQRAVTGIFERNAETAGKSPEWAVRLDAPYVIGGRVFDVMEVYDSTDDLSPFLGKHVTVSGTFVEWRTPERGKFIVLEICDISPTEK